jgi:Zn-dependent protease
VPLVDYSQLLILFLVLIMSVTLHAAAQAWSADMLGDPTAAAAERLSFSPGAHVDPVGTVIFPLVSFVGGFGVFGWGKPVPVETRELAAGWRWKLALIAIAGPACSLLLAGLVALSIRGGVSATHSPLDAMTAPLLFRAMDMNVRLGILHLLPVPPLDGSMLLAAALPAGAGRALRARQTIGAAVLFGLLLTGLLGSLLNPIRSALVDVLV